MIKTDNIELFLPHRGKMLLLSKILDYNIEDGILHSEFNITENCIFYNHNMGGVPSWVGFELIAQSISALIGIRCCILGIKPQMGLLLKVSSLKTEMPVFNSGSIASIRIKQIDHTQPTYTFKGEVYLGDKLAIKGNIMVIEINENDERFIEVNK